MPMWKQKNKIQQNKKDIAFDIATVDCKIKLDT